MSEHPVAYQRKSARARQQELIDAGITCLGKQGMSGFTIDQICKTAGVSRGLVNHHFQSKEALLTRIYLDMTDHLVVSTASASAEMEIKSIIETSFDESSFNRSNLRAWLAVWGQVPGNPVLKEIHLTRYRAYQRRIKKALTELLDHQAFEVDSIARQLIALMDGLWLEYCLNAEGFTLADARSDCLEFLRVYGIPVD